MPLDISGSTQLVVLYGKPIKHSLSPLMHNTAFRKLNLDYVYLAIEPRTIEGGIQAARELEMRGLNITSPFKVDALNNVDKLADVAKNAHSLNTIYWERGQLVGTNTDVSAIKLALLDKIGSISGCKVLIAGAGGVARAVIASLHDASIKLFNRNISKREEIVKLYPDKDIQPDDIKNISRQIPKADILVNATPIGLHTQDSVFNLNQINENHLVLDLVYRKGGTKLIQESNTKGAKTIDGGEILVLQGIEAFKLWTGLDAPKDIMRKVVRRALR